MNNQEVEQKHMEMEEGLRNFCEEKGHKYEPQNKKIVAIAYLELNTPYEKGKVPEGFLDRLKTAWDNGDHGMIISTMGHHDCEFCTPPNVATSSSEKMLTDSRNKIRYIFPEMIFHYVKDHEYLPPPAFILMIMGGFYE